MHILAIDPGRTGAFCLLGREGIVKIWDWPKVTERVPVKSAFPKKGKKQRFKELPLDDIEIGEYLDILQWVESNYTGVCYVVEEVHPFTHRKDKETGEVRAMGIKSTGDFMRHTGDIRSGILAITGKWPDFIPARTWQAAMLHRIPNDGMDTKNKSLMRANELFPGTDYFKRKKDSGRSDAALLAYYYMHYVPREL